MIVWDDGTRKQRVYEMWQENFHDPVPYADFYFQEVYGKNEVLLNQEEDATVKGMLHLNPYTLHVEGQPTEAKYIVGVATDEEYRRQGVMRELLVKTFQTLRDRGELFTYLMPADENYYLPFDFRFGMAQIEQELEYLPGQADIGQSESQMDKEEKANQNGDRENGQNLSAQSVSQPESYSIKTELSDEELERIVLQENTIKDTLFDIYTEISVAYIRRMEKEVESDFGQVLYVFDGEDYVGRVAVGAEDSYFVLSQVFCAQRSKRTHFLEQVILYCEKKYHYNRYQLILDPSWKDVTTKIGLQGSFRYMPAKQVKKIMFRLLNVEGLGKLLKYKVENNETDSIKESCGKENQQVDAMTINDYKKAIYEADIYIEDTYLEAQSGVYHFLLKEGNVSITKTELSEKEDMPKISIATLTEYLFGGEKQGIEASDTLTAEAKGLLKNICPLAKNCIMEIV